MHHPNSPHGNPTESYELGNRGEILMQDRRDSEYRKAWQDAPESFKRSAGSLGIEADPERRTGVAMAFDEARDTVSHTPDFAEQIDSTVEKLIERHGNESLVREIVASLEEPMKMESYRTQAGAIIRVVSWLIMCPKGNARARIHGVMHSIPGLPQSSNIRSLRESAKICGVSPEWMKQARDQACEWLGLPVPANEKKSEEAKAKYRLRPHWRHAKVKA
jgi:hypothetical protein